MELFSSWIEVKSVETFDKNHTFDKKLWVILLLFLATVLKKKKETIWSNHVGVLQAYELVPNSCVDHSRDFWIIYRKLSFPDVFPMVFIEETQ